MSQARIQAWVALERIADEQGNRGTALIAAQSAFDETIAQAGRGVISLACSLANRLLDQESVEAAVAVLDQAEAHWEVTDWPEYNEMTWGDLSNTLYVIQFRATLATRNDHRMWAATERFLVRLDQGLLTQHAFLAVRHMGEGLVEAARTGNISYAQAFARRILLHVRDEHAHVGSADKIQWQLFARWTEELIESTEQVIEANLEAGMDAPSSFHRWLHEDNRADEWVPHEKMRRQ